MAVSRAYQMSEQAHDGSIHNHDVPVAFCYLCVHGRPLTLRGGVT